MEGLKVPTILRRLLLFLTEIRFQMPFNCFNHCPRNKLERSWPSTIGEPTHKTGHFWKAPGIPQIQD
jgi:hypothetical protein